MAEIERITIALRALDVDELRRCQNAGKASGLAGEVNLRDLIAGEKSKKCRVVDPRLSGTGPSMPGQG